ncbi:unnamed protein product [Gordionus sp. m RMFG-2023]
MFLRKLKSLDYHNRNDFDCANDVFFKKLIVWLEINHLKFRKLDRNLHDLNNINWFNYLKEIACPYLEDERHEILDWLLGVAIKLKFNDNLEKYQNVGAKLNLGNENIQHSNSLDNLDFDSTDFKDGVAQLSNILNIPQHPNHLITLEAICKFILETFSIDKTKLIKVGKPPNIKDNKTLSLDEIDLGFSCENPKIRNASKILRLLCIQDLRALQTQINEAIVISQNVTADPKTDQSLGKVGR